AGLLLNRGQRTVHDLLRRAALAVAHQRADELRHQRAAVQRIERNFALWNFSASWHVDLSRLRFRPLRAVLRTSLLASLHTNGVERAADHVVPDAREILDT